MEGESPVCSTVSATGGTADCVSVTVGSPKMADDDFNDSASAPRLNGSEVSDSEEENVCCWSSRKIDVVFTKYRVLYVERRNNQYNAPHHPTEFTVGPASGLSPNPR